MQYRVPDDQTLVTHSVNRGVPVAMSHARSSLGKAFYAFARRVVEDVAKEDPAWAGVQTQVDGNLLGRFLRRPKPVEA